MSVAEQADQLDALIIGGGIAGLWILDELRRAGFACLLVEREALGAGQTIWSQGIIHGGLKYTLGGLMNPSAEAIREMPSVWRACLAGEREPDLSDAGGGALRAPCCHLWRTATLASKIGMIGARAGLRVAPVVLDRGERPEILRNCPGVVARLDEQVIDPAAVLRALARRNAGRIVLGEVSSARSEGDRVRLRVARASHAALHESVARWLILCAGNGNAALRELLGLPAGRTQVRPLRMVMARGGGLPVLNGHCVDGTKTRVTITTARDSTGRNIWQIGGEVAERGASMSAEKAMRLAADELRAVLPGIDLAGIEWSTYEAPRAEAASPGRIRPDDAVVIEDGAVLTVFPTKLALAPRAAEQVLRRIGGEARRSGGAPPASTDPPVVAPAPWESAAWTRGGAL